jgi:ABC-type Fe3+ transport system permease subunit
VPLVGSAIAGAAIITPVLVVLWRSFTTGRLGFNVGFNIANYLRVFGDKDIMAMLVNSVVYAGGSALLGTGVGALLAWIVARTNTPGKTLVELLPLYPILMPPIMKNIAWILLLAPRSGILNGMLQQFFGIETPIFNAFSMTGMIWVFGLACVPLGYLFLLPVFLSFDPSLEESAYIAGSKPVNTMLKITFPLAVPAFHGAGVQHGSGDGLQRGFGGALGDHALLLCARDPVFRSLRDDYRKRLSRQGYRHRALEIPDILPGIYLLLGGHRDTVHCADRRVDDSVLRL